MHRPPLFHGFISERNEFFWPHHARSILNKYVLLLQARCSVFPRNFPKKLAQGPTRSCWRDVCGPYFWHLQCLWNCRLFTVLAVFTVLRSDKYVRCGFEISRKHRKLVFVFCLLVRLIWFGEAAKLNLFFQISKEWTIPTIFALMYGGKRHAQECIFHRYRSTKIKSLYIGPSHAGASCSYLPMQFLFSWALTLIVIVLGKFESPGIGLKQILLH